MVSLLNYFRLCIQCAWVHRSRDLICEDDRHRCGSIHLFNVRYQVSALLRGEMSMAWRVNEFA